MIVHFSRQTARTQTVGGRFESTRRSDALSFALKIHKSYLTISLKARSRRRRRLFHRRFQDGGFRRGSPSRAEKRGRACCSVRTTRRRVPWRSRPRSSTDTRAGSRCRRRAFASRSGLCVVRRSALKRQRRLGSRDVSVRISQRGRSHRALSVQLPASQEFSDFRERRRRVARLDVRDLTRRRRSADARRPRGARARHLTETRHPRSITAPVPPPHPAPGTLRSTHRSSEILSRPASVIRALARALALAVRVSLPKESSHERLRQLGRASHRRGHARPHALRSRRRRHPRHRVHRPSIARFIAAHLQMSAVASIVASPVTSRVVSRRLARRRRRRSRDARARARVPRVRRSTRTRAGR